MSVHLWLVDNCYPYYLQGLIMTCTGPRNFCFPGPLSPQKIQKVTFCGCVDIKAKIIQPVLFLFFLNICLSSILIKVIYISFLDLLLQITTKQVA